ncbi:8-oxo-dGTP diphosphatase MutT [Geminocystis sp. NIES-3709]|uniref:8-oxo-dGTP diphosphatase MutT n=1 Tax=Geminocystis sp. NIES-3709 TaxID=1617448 RepID=UPI0005FCAA15|nr:8-oxo-dGTP diphosphatase MutT [Geminocystis sp. NIES-3709]BAQ66421.1 A/G-specific adenine glycosylase [Geminocystis sp. NIES-3709]
MNLPHKKIGVAVIVNEEEKILIDKRLPTGLMANLWEFPGGKIEARETPEDCIRREIQEELGVIIEVDRHLIDITHSYSEFSVTLCVYICKLIEGQPQPLQCAEVRWVEVSQLHNFEFPTANKEIISTLELTFNK